MSPKLAKLKEDWKWHFDEEQVHCVFHCHSSQQIIVWQSEWGHWPARRADQHHIHYYYRRTFHPRDPLTFISSQPAVLDNLLTSMKFVLHGMGALRINLANNRNKVACFHLVLLKMSEPQEPVFISLAGGLDQNVFPKYRNLLSIISSKMITLNYVPGKINSQHLSVWVCVSIYTVCHGCQ